MNIYAQHTPRGGLERMMRAVPRPAFRLGSGPGAEGSSGPSCRDCSSYQIGVGCRLAASRAAIRGGLNDETAYSIADILLQELSRCKDAESMMRVQMETMHTFATYVKEAREAASHLNYVEKAKHYLNEHINKPFTLDALAAEVGLNKSYLCRKFKAREGVTIFQHIKALRVEAAKNMLRYSDMELSAMASYLCFPSQSKFGEAFKQITGVTPKRYRDENAPGEGGSI